MFKAGSKVFVAGHRGMVGSAILRQLEQQGEQHIISAGRDQVDLVNQQSVRDFFERKKPDYVVVAAAKVGGILANNTYPADFIYENLMIEANLIEASFRNQVDGLLFLGSSCIYPKMANQPMQESELLTGALEPTNEPYGVAKIAGIKLCESYNRQHGTDYRSVMPTNLYGPHDNFHPENSHVIPAMIRRFHEAKQNKLDTVTCWGTGSAMREFLHVDDMAAACLHVMSMSKAEYQTHTETMLSHINVGTGIDVTIKELAETIAAVVGFEGHILWDTDKPDGTPRKLMDISRLHSMGWEASFNLRRGLKDAYQWFESSQDVFRR